MDNDPENDHDFENTIQIIEDIQNGCFGEKKVKLEKKISLFGIQKPEVFSLELTDRTWNNNPLTRRKKEEISFKDRKCLADGRVYIQKLIKNSCQIYRDVSAMTKMKLSPKRNKQNCFLVIKRPSLSGSSQQGVVNKENVLSGNFSLDSSFKSENGVKFGNCLADITNKFN